MSKEVKTIIRFENYHRCSSILMDFFSWVSKLRNLKNHGFLLPGIDLIKQTVLELRFNGC
jgi:hypothetical protein